MRNEKMTVRVLGASKGAWYEKNIGDNFLAWLDRGTSEWVMGERRVPYSDAKPLLNGNIPQWSTIAVKFPDGKEAIGVATSNVKFSDDIIVHYISGGSGALHPRFVTQVIDPGRCYGKSEAYQVAEFYHTWKSKRQVICSKCRQFHFHSLGCSCIGKGSDVAHKLTTEQIDRHNSNVIYNEYKKRLTQYSRFPNGYVSDKSIDFLKEVGAEIKAYYDILGAEKVQALREVYKKEVAFLKAKLAKQSV